MPNCDMPRTTLVFGTFSISVESGYVTWSSTSCGAWPGHSVMTMTWTSDRSGIASTGVVTAAHTLASVTARVVSSTTNLRLTDHSMMRSSMAGYLRGVVEG